MHGRCSGSELEVFDAEHIHVRRIRPKIFADQLFGFVAVSSDRPHERRAFPDEDFRTGVGVSALEMAQNSERLVGTAEEVDHQLHKMMENIHKVSAEAAAEYGLGYDLVAGANIAGFKKVADAMMAQGIV